MMTPISPDIKLMDVEEFGYWMKQWGGGLKGWTMAQTLQKLKDAQRKGAKQIKWQQYVRDIIGESKITYNVHTWVELYKCPS